MHFLTDGPSDGPRFLFAHGAGGAMDTPFMTLVAQRIAGEGFRVVRFEFPYMAARRQGRKSGAPDRQPRLLESWREAVGLNRGDWPLFIGGKSLGGRMASLVADELEVDGLICFGYPFHPPGDPAKLRTAHLGDLRTPTLILQGERDPFGSLGEVSSYGLSPSIRVEWLADGDHSFKPRVASGATHAANLARAAALAGAFMRDAIA